MKNLDLITAFDSEIADMYRQDFGIECVAIPSEAFADRLETAREAYGAELNRLNTETAKRSASVGFLRVIGDLPAIMAPASAWATALTQRFNEDDDANRERTKTLEGRIARLDQMARDLGGAGAPPSLTNDPKLQFLFGV